MENKYLNILLKIVTAILLISTSFSFAASNYNAIKEFERGIELSKKNKIDDALRIFNEMNITYPHLVDPYNNAAVIYFEKNMSEQAMLKIEQGLKLDPYNKNLNENRKIILQQSNSKNKTNVSLIEPAKFVDNLISQSDKTEDPKKELSMIVNNWASAWSSKNVRKYLSYYHDDFIPPAKLSIRQWREQRYKRINDRDNINVQIVDPVVEIGSEFAAVVTFKQLYKSNKINETSNKVLVFIKDSPVSPWKIVEERISY